MLVATAVVSVIAVLCAAELALALLQPVRRMPVLKDGLRWVPDKDLGHRAKGGHKGVYRDRPRCCGERRLTISTDERGHRVTVGGPGQGRFAAFFGCSFVFGWRLDDSETIPSVFASKRPEYRVYNFAFHDYGTNQLYSFVRSKPLRRWIAEDKGVFIYVYAEPHLPRTTGEIVTFTPKRPNSPYYALEDGQLVHRGTFGSARPIRSWVARRLVTSQLWWRVRPWIKLSQETGIRLTSELIVASKRRFESLYPGSRFVVVFYPGSSYTARIREWVEQRGVETIDLSRLFNAYAPHNCLDDDDLHPTPRVAGLFAERLAREI